MKHKQKIGTYIDEDETYYEDKTVLQPLIDTMKRDLIHIKGEVELHNYSTQSGRLLERYIDKYIYAAENL